MSGRIGDRLVNNACHQGFHGVCERHTGGTVHDSATGRTYLCECECHGLVGVWRRRSTAGRSSSSTTWPTGGSSTPAKRRRRKRPS